MKNLKNILVALLALIIAVTVIVGSTISVNAINANAQKAFEAQGYGSFEEGVIPPFPYYSWYHPSIKDMEDIGHPNLNFEKGLEYWTVGGDNNTFNAGILKPTTFVELKKEANGNHYISLTPIDGYDGIVTVKFPFNKLKVGDTPGLLYKWRGDSHAMQVSLEQYYDADLAEEGGKTLRIGHNGDRGSKNIWTADEDNEDEWNIQLSINLKPVTASTSENSTIYYHVICESTQNAEISKGLDIDDVQIVIHNDATQKVYDLDGKLLYDLNNLPKREVVDYIFAEDLPEKDDRAKLKVDIDSLLDGSKDLDNVATEQSDKNDKDVSSNNSLIWIIIAVAVVLLLAAGAVVFVILKKKKSTVTNDTKNET